MVQKWFSYDLVQSSANHCKSLTGLRTFKSLKYSLSLCFVTLQGCEAMLRSWCLDCPTQARYISRGVQLKICWIPILSTNYSIQRNIQKHGRGHISPRHLGKLPPSLSSGRPLARKQSSKSNKAKNSCPVLRCYGQTVNAQHALNSRESGATPVTFAFFSEVPAHSKWSKWSIFPLLKKGKKALSQTRLQIRT